MATDAAGEGLNLVAAETREGQVFTRLLEKMEVQRAAYDGRLFDVLGDAFNDRSLRELLMEAIRYGNDPARMAELNRVVDAEVAKGCHDLIAERALAKESLSAQQLDEMRRRIFRATPPSGHRKSVWMPRVVPPSRS